MSVLLLKRGDKRGGSQTYKVLKQHPKITACAGRESRSLGKYKGIQFRSSSMPAGDFSDLPPTVYLRGTSRGRDGEAIYVPTNWVESFETAVVHLNHKYGNNKHLSVDDVIWKRGWK